MVVLLILRWLNFQLTFHIVAFNTGWSQFAGHQAFLREMSRVEVIFLALACDFKLSHPVGKTGLNRRL